MGLDNGSNSNLTKVRLDGWCYGYPVRQRDDDGMTMAYDRKE